MSKSVELSGIEQKIFIIRGQKVMIDRDLAGLFGVETKYLNRQVRRNKARFPNEFAFSLTPAEKDELVTICHRFASMKHSSSMPYAFTEHGVGMLATVLNSEQAIRMSIAIIKTFVKLREMLSANKELALKLGELENRIEKHDEDIAAIFEAIRELMTPPAKPKREIGFHAR
jgi:phage regulator Rha-like protein